MSRPSPQKPHDQMTTGQVAELVSAGTRERRGWRDWRDDLVSLALEVRRGAVMKTQWRKTAEAQGRLDLAERYRAEAEKMWANARVYLSDARCAHERLTQSSLERHTP